MNVQHEQKIIDIRRGHSIQALNAAGGARTPGMEQLGRTVIHLGQAAKKSASAFKELASRAQTMSGQFGKLSASAQYLASELAEGRLMSAVDRFLVRKPRHQYPIRVFVAVEWKARMLQTP